MIRVRRTRVSKGLYWPDPSKKENFFGIFLGAILGLVYHVVNEFSKNSNFKVAGTSIENDCFFEVSRPAT